MDIEWLSDFCLFLPGAKAEIKWVKDLCFTVAGKLFCVTGLEGDFQFSFKVQDELFEELSIDELNDMEDEYTEINCAHCNKPIFIEQSALSNNDEIPCPYCHKNIKDNK